MSRRCFGLSRHEVYAHCAGGMDWDAVMRKTFSMASAFRPRQHSAVMSLERWIGAWCGVDARSKSPRQRWLSTIEIVPITPVPLTELPIRNCEGAATSVSGPLSVTRTGTLPSGLALGGGVRVSCLEINRATSSCASAHFGHSDMQRTRWRREVEFQHCSKLMAIPTTGNVRRCSPKSKPRLGRAWDLRDLRPAYKLPNLHTTSHP